MAPAGLEPRAVGPPSPPGDLVFDALDSPIAVVDATGRIVAVNAAWDEGARTRSTEPWKCGVGASYLAVCDHAAGPDSEGVADIAAGIRDVLAGERERFAVDYPCTGPGGRRWFSLRVSPIHGPEGGAVLIHHDITPLREAEQQARLDEARLLRAFDESSPIFLLLEPDGTVAFISDHTCALLDFDRGAVVGVAGISLVDEADAERVREAQRSVVSAPGNRAHLRCRVIDGSGRRRQVELTVVNLLEDPEVRAVAVVGTDVTDTRLHQIATRLEGRLLQRFPAAVVVTDDQGVVVYWNERAEEMSGVPAAEVVGRRLEEVGVTFVADAVRHQVVDATTSTGRWEGDYDVALPDGSTIPLHTVVERVVDDEIDFRGIVAASIDISQRRQLERELAFQALHDPLTGLPNRRRFVERLERVLQRAEERRTAVAFLDLDDFKELNDRVGHLAGDQALHVIGDRLREVLRDDDVVARIGGDEFVIGMVGVADTEEALAIAERILEAVHWPMEIDGQRLQVAATIGVAMAQPDVGAELLLRNADAAMYEAKELGKNRVALFDDAFRERTRARRGFADRLRSAVRAGKIHARFQPQTDLATGRLVGFEALARWSGDDEEFERSARFLSVAEEGGVVGEIDRLMLTQTCDALARLHAERPDLGCTISVNLSGELLSDPAFPALVADHVSAGGFPPRLLCIEVVESVLADVEAVADNLAQLERLGVEVAIDDFGTGYSSLSRIQEFHVDYLKIDRSFVATVGAEDGRDAVVAAIIGLGTALGLRTIAEGVETDDQVEQLRRFGVDIGQGFRWSPAVPYDDALALVRAAPAA